MSNCICDCVYGSKRRVSFKGNIEHGDFVVVGSSPSSHDIVKETLFQGEVGKVLFSCLKVPKEALLLTTATQCRSPSESKSKKPEAAVIACSPRLLEEISFAPRKVILALGNEALWALTGDTSLRITKVRGQVFPSNLSDYGIVASVHPSFLIQGGGSYKKFEEDIQLAMDLYEGRPVKKYVDPEYHIYTTPSEMDNLVNLIQEANPTEIAVDIETTGFSAKDDEILSIGLCWDPEVAHIVHGTDLRVIMETVTRKKSNKNVTTKELIGNLPVLVKGSYNMDKLKVILENDKRKFIWQNGKFDIRFLRERVINAVVDADTMLMNYALDMTRGIHSLDKIGSDLLGIPNWKEMLEEYLPRKKASYAHIPPEVLALYLSKDVSVTLQVHKILKQRLEEDPPSHLLYYKTLLPASVFLLDVEKTGFMLDWDKWQENKDILAKQLEELLSEIHTIAGYEINPNSSVQMCTLLFDEMNLKSSVRSSSKEVIDLLPKIPIINALISYRKASKEYSTYIIGLAKNIHSDNRAHADFLLHGTATGRLSCKDPNLQNIPRRPEMRGMFRAAFGYTLMEADYSQAELRMLAQLSEDPELLQVYNEGRSLHKEMAKHLFGVDYDPTQYVQTKALNFGIVYGITGHTIAEKFGLTGAEANNMIQGWYDKFHVAGKFIQACRDAPRKGQNLLTVFGRRKRFGVVSKMNLNATENKFANFPHQSTASDLTLHAGMKAAPKLALLGGKIVNLVHDSTITEIPDKEDVKEKAKQIMEYEMLQAPIDWGLTKIPFEVDFKFTAHWGT